jgi:hypothetical protein
LRKKLSFDHLGNPGSFVGNPGTARVGPCLATDLTPATLFTFSLDNLFKISTSSSFISSTSAIFIFIIGSNSSCINLEFSRNVNTRGNSLKLAKNQFQYDARKYYFVNRIVSIWNSLPNETVPLTSLDSFKYHLDKVWSSQDIKYDWRANVAGTGAVSLNL